MRFWCVWWMPHTDARSGLQVGLQSPVLHARPTTSFAMGDLAVYQLMPCTDPSESSSDSAVSSMSYSGTLRPDFDANMGCRKEKITSIPQRRKCRVTTQSHLCNVTQNTKRKETPPLCTAVMAAGHSFEGKISSA